MIDTTNLPSLIGADVVDRDGEKIGTVGQIYVNSETNEPLWASVRTGLFGMSESFVSLEGANSDSDTLRVTYEKDFVKDAPRIDADGALSEDEEAALYDYYRGDGVPSGATTNDDLASAGVSGRTTTDRTATDGTATDSAASGSTGTTGYDTSGPTTDDAMTRSEEQLRVGTERVETGRVRLRKYVVTENETVTVPVSREEVRLEREPITDANVDSATSGPAISEEEHEVILTAERPVVEKTTTPVERVRLNTETVTEDAQVSEELRKERIELEGDEADLKNRPSAR
ncbi:uncharacterized protein (TIGR02271 family) [Glaciihabitans tibetensis]|uniref:Uncharacterized protein (TIGR02271 family) n=1 Tax=Glaciihabitans tibetensis TaxID=1266600 RepID=A0A2T0VE84_9MICO|nr:PRC and DUF2382 domain-containing protein [Glaciihabitans tibetensis]PRY68491.1 uncharacterized protein (TIGR02271 family) [Glaciihabitans tibetensis]